MVAPTQAEIDEAVMIAKNATYKLAYELALEQKYGGVIDCCVTKLKLLWMYERALACHKEYLNASGTIELTLVENLDFIIIYVNEVNISGTYTFTNDSEATQMALLAGVINAYQSDYVAYFDATLGSVGKITLTGQDCTAGDITISTGKATSVIVDLVGVCTVNCLTDEKAKKLIAKIKSMCNTN